MNFDKIYEQFEEYVEITKDKERYIIDNDIIRPVNEQDVLTAVNTGYQYYNDSGKMTLDYAVGIATDEKMAITTYTSLEDNEVKIASPVIYQIHTVCGIVINYAITKDMCKLYQTDVVEVIKKQMQWMKDIMEIAGALTTDKARYMVTYFISQNKNLRNYTVRELFKND